jgi:hypothetical protein
VSGWRSVNTDKRFGDGVTAQLTKSKDLEGSKPLSDNLAAVPHTSQPK